MKLIGLMVAMVMFVFAQGQVQDVLLGQSSAVVYLKNGSVIKGMIIEQVPNVSITIMTQDGNRFVFDLTEIQKITPMIPKETETVSEQPKEKPSEQIESKTEENNVHLRVGYANVSGVGMPVFGLYWGQQDRKYFWSEMGVEYWTYSDHTARTTLLSLPGGSVGIFFPVSKTARIHFGGGADWVNMANISADGYSETEWTWFKGWHLIGEVVASFGSTVGMVYFKENWQKIDGGDFFNTMSIGVGVGFGI